jgi:hypothetical protein
MCGLSAITVAWMIDVFERIAFVAVSTTHLATAKWERYLTKTTEFDLLLKQPKAFTESVLLLVLLVAMLLRDLVTTGRACAGRLSGFSAACESTYPERQGEASSRAAVVARYMLSLT